MGNSYHNFLENIDKNGLLPQNTQFGGLSGGLSQAALSQTTTQTGAANIFSQKTENAETPTGATFPTFGNLTSSQKERKNNGEFINNSAIIDGFDTDILSNSKFKKIDDKTLKLKVKIARLKAELEEHSKLVEQTFLKTDKIQYQKLLEIQKKMEAEIQRLVAEYQHRQLISIVFSPFVKLLHLLKIM